MKIGIAAENRPEEKRVIILPAQISQIANSYEVFVEQGAGKGIGVGDAQYEEVGAKVADKKE